MSFSFANSQQFLDDTMALSRHTKPMKVNALRLAFAKDAGFSSTQAYIEDMDRNAVQARKSALDENTWIRRKGNLLVFQAQAGFSQSDFFNIEEWNDAVEEILTGPHGLQEIGQEIIDGKPYVSGYIDLNESEEYIADAVAHFIKAQEDVKWGGPEIQAAIVWQLTSAFQDCAQGINNPLRTVFDTLVDRNLDRCLVPSDFNPVIEEVRAGKSSLVRLDASAKHQAIGLFSESLQHDRIEQKRVVIESKLNERTACMLSTLVNVVLEMDPDTYMTSKDFVSGMQDAQVTRTLLPLLAASFFSGLVYTLDDLEVVVQ